MKEKKFNNPYLDSVDWDLYLEREQEIFLFTCDVPLYGQKLKEEMGIGFEHLFIIRMALGINIDQKRSWKKRLNILLS